MYMMLDNATLRVISIVADFLCAWFCLAAEVSQSTALHKQIQGATPACT